MGARGWKRLRVATQALALLLFLYLLLGTRPGSRLLLPHDLFFRLDPLVGASAMAAGRQWLAPMVIGAVTLALALVVGRAWCGWVCPLGTLLDWVNLPAARRKRTEDGLSRWRRVKYLVLLALAFAAALGSLTLLVLDPVTLLFRTLASVALPAVDHAVTWVEEVLYSASPLFQGTVERFDAWARPAVLPSEGPLARPDVLVALAFIAVLGLNAIRSRFWCRYLCPLGALLALAARVTWLRPMVDESACNSCSRCARACPTRAIEPDHAVVHAAECTLCLDCVEACPKEAIAIKGTWKAPEWQPYDLSRRQAMASLGIAAVGTALLRTVPAAQNHHPLRLRPPGVDEKRMMSRCVRCGECVKVCPTGGLQPGAASTSWEGLWTPVLAPRVGYCDYSCNACGTACPTRAIPELPLEEKRVAVIGVAHIDEERCIPYAEGRDCIVCEEMCPVPKKAVVLEEKEVVTSDGTTTLVRQPKVVEKHCTGCGICEHQCPLNGEAAIRIEVMHDVA